MEILDQVRALVAARIAERERRTAARRESCHEFREASLGAAPCESCARSRQKGSPFGDFPVARRRVVLPSDLRVPSVEPRPPNLHAANLSFAARVVLAVRDRFGGDAPKVYTAAKVTRQAYSQIVSDETHAVSKRTAVRFAFALHLTSDEARLLLKSAGYAFSNAQTEDFILQACLEVDPPVWDLDTVNALLREYRVDYQY